MRRVFLPLLMLVGFAVVVVSAQAPTYPSLPSLAINGSLVSGSSLTVGGTSGTWTGNPGSTTVIRAHQNATDGCADALQIWPKDNPLNQGPGVRILCYGDLLSNRSIRISGSTITGTVPQMGGSSMLAVQSDLGPGYPVVVIEGNISEDMVQPLISGYGNATERFHVSTHGKMWLRGPAAGLEVSRSGGSGPITVTLQGQPTTTSDNQPISDIDIYSNTGDLVGRLRLASSIGNDGGQWVFSVKTSSGSLNEAARFSPYGVTFAGLASTGAAYACLDANGKLYRSATPCV